MGNIRGKHSSPGIYIKNTDIHHVVKATDLEEQLKNAAEAAAGGGGGGGGGHKPIKKHWVFGDDFPAYFS